MISVKWKNTDKLNKKLNNIANRLQEATSSGINKALDSTKNLALEFKRGKKEGIEIELVDTSTNEIKGRVYTDQNVIPYSWFLEFGTGQYAELEHIGHTKHFAESGYTEWFIPIDQVKEPLRFPIITINEKQFYLAHGSKPSPFMRKAGFENRDNNLDIVQKEILDMIKGAIR